MMTRGGGAALAAVVLLIYGNLGCGGGSDKAPSDKPAKPGDVSSLTLQGLPVTIPLPGLSGGSGLTYSLAAQPAHGTAVMAGGAVTYSPAGDFAGEDTFTFTATDGKGTSEPATVRVSVLPVTGPVVPGGTALDVKIRDLLAGLRIQGGLSISIAHDGKLVFARGYGYAHHAVNPPRPFAPDALARVASVSKILTMMATMHLVDVGALSLDDRLLDLLPAYRTPAPRDPRTSDITVRDLLRHSGGWDASMSGDPMIDQLGVATGLGVPGPLACRDIFGWTLTARALDFTPGAKHVYANVGFCALSLVVEAVGGLDYQTYVRNEVLAALGIHDARFGGSLEADAAPGEVHYGEPNLLTCPSVFPTGPRDVPCAYGRYSIPAWAGAGAWIASAVDLTRVMDALGPGTTAFLSPSSLAQVTSCATVPGASGVFFGKEYCYSLGLYLRTDPEGITMGHQGNFSSGTHATAYRLADGWTYAIVNNSDTTALSSDLLYLTDSTWPLIEEVIRGGFVGSPTDLYPTFPSPDLGPYSGN